MLERLARQAKPDDPLLIEMLVNTYFEELVRLGLSILNDEDEAKDAAQATLIAAINNLHRFRRESSLKTWLFSIGINTCRGKLRRRKSRQRIQNVLEQVHLIRTQATPSPEHHVVQHEQDARLWQAVDALDEKHRLPVILRYVHEMSASEIAETLHLNEGTVHSRLHYARKKLRDLLNEPAGSAAFAPEDLR
jgi:RNA polymerase sigma-70 factor (ECF subfamily)